MAHTKVTKTYSQNTGTANTFSYSGSFETFKGTEVVALLDNVKLTYTASTINESASPREYTVDTSAKTIHIGGADLSSGTVIIRPETDLGSPTPRAEFTPGASITSADLNNNQKQLLRRAMEYEETVLFNTGGTMTGDLTIGEDQTIIFEGATDDGYETTLTVTDPTADRTITIPNVTGTVVTTGDTATVTATMMAADSVDSSELVDGSIDTSHISSSAVTTGKIAADAVTGAKIADDAINSEHYTDGSIDTAHIADLQVTTAKIANDAVTSAKIATNAVTSTEIDGNAVGATELADDAVDTASIQDSAVTTAKIAADAINHTKIADDTINSEHYVDGSIDTAHIADANITTAKLATDAVTTAKITDANVTTAKIAADAITAAKIADDVINSEHYAAGSIDTEHIADLNVTTAKIAADAITSAKIADDAVTHEHIVADAIRTAEIQDDAVTTDKIADAAVNAAKIADANVTANELGSNAVTTAKILDSNVTTAKLAADSVTIAKIGCEQTTISDSDSHIPTSGAVVDYVASIINPIGGLEVIADDESFPNTIPAAGVVISITDAAGLQVNSSGVSTNGDALDNSTITINGFPSELRGGVGSNADPYVFGSGAGLMVVSTGSSHTYNYHQAMIREADFVQLSDDINDFNSRYRIHAGEPSSNNDDGDLVWDTNADKMKVYDATASAWTEVTSTGDFKFLVPVDAGTTTAASWDGSDTSFDLKETSNTGSAASVSNINQLIVSLNGVIQKPNTGSYSASEEGFYLTDSDTIRFCTAPPSGSTAFILQIGSAVSIPTPGDGTVSAAKIASGAVTTAKIADSNVTLAKMAANSVDSDQYVDGSVDHVHLAGDCVDGDNLADNACDSEHYTDGSIDAVHLSDDAVSTAKMQNDAVTGAKIADDAVGAEHIEQLDADLSFADNTNAKFGAGNDLLLYSDGTQGIIRSANGRGYVQSDTGISISNIGYTEKYIEATKDGAVELYYDNSKKFETHSGGCIFTGDLYGLDTAKIRLGNSNDFELYHDGSNSYVTDQGTGALLLAGNEVKIINAAHSENGLVFDENGAIKLYYDNAIKLQTTSTGVTVSSSGHAELTVKAANNSDAILNLNCDNEDNDADHWRFVSQQANNKLAIQHKGSGSYADKFDIDSSGNVSIGGGLTSANTAKCWIKLNMSSGSVLDSFNVSSVSDEGTGTFDVNFSTAITNEHAAAVAGVSTSALHAQIVYGSSDGNGFQFRCLDGGGSLADDPNCSLVIFDN